MRPAHRLATASLAVLSLALAASSAVAATQALPIIPVPAELSRGSGVLVVRSGAVVSVPAGDAGALWAARLLAAQVKQTRGLDLVVREGGAGQIVLARDPSVTAAEGYGLTVTPKGARIAAKDDAGLLYGAMTLAQLLSPDAAFGQPVKVPALTVRDQPRFAWRGIMVDVARHFQPAESLKPLIDAMAAHKMNVLHLHLSDDQGWRVEIKRYPKLTEIGAWRTPPTAGEAPSVQPYGGFYTQDQIRDLVAYARERSVTIVPEIDLPGHAQAAVAAYPEIGVFGDRPSVAVDWGVNPYLFDVDQPSLTFIEGVLDELMSLFPSTYIHVGGDEAIKDQWQRSPAVQARMRELGLKNEHEMQSWFIEHLGKYLAAHGRRLIGWDEILEGGLPASASVMSWRGEQGAIDAANQGHDVVLSPAPILYLDSLQSDRADEPPGRLSIMTLKDVYGYEPMPKGIAPDKVGHVLGAQANAWSEYLVTPAQIRHAIFPRLDAVSEITWSPKDKRDWTGFLDRLDIQRLRYARQGINAADSAFAVGFALDGGRGSALRSGKASVVLSTQTGFGQIRYTLDGKAPTTRSPLYAKPLAVAVGTTIRAAAFTADGRATAAPRAFDLGRTALLTRSNSDLTACPKGALGLRVPLTSEAQADAPAFNVNLFDTCALYPAAPLDLAGGFEVKVARVPRHYGLAGDTDKVRWHYNATRFGELIVRAGGCEGRVVATFPLPDPATASNRLTFKGELPEEAGDSDLCLLFTAPLSGPFYAVEALALTPRVSN
ncbi:MULTISPECIES: beta-N-acetylhexosaminidase [unclassified Caulobacter]|uniref:beta-N-acetylhexosaminidase n=1 Tax=unclassified Caulobacter TaxID=2648921 RepID=UPI0006FF1BAB|nr:MULTISPECIES: family 20 glycosylhydrolase [unclassified Caulobacter]KQV57022.1 beta-hexosaminidase [Caulobacter sp. Root342]KQV66508.1 beta-hexosaminidase [Caulobacter sp. Root343]